MQPFISRCSSGDNVGAAADIDGAAGDDGGIEDDAHAAS
jgi:hypothetical protein